jgi:C-terminal processing protease CtpA/Prc
MEERLSSVRQVLSERNGSDFCELNRFLNTNDDFGALKLTIQKFYRVSGESTQRKGVEADLKMKDFFLCRSGRTF